VLRVLLPSIRPVLCPMDDETLNGFFEDLGHQGSQPYRQHADTGGVQGISSTALGSVDGSSGLHCQQREIYSVSSSGTGVAGRFSQLKATQREDEADPQGSRTAPAERTSVSTTILPISWETECSIPNNTGSSLILQVTCKRPCPWEARIIIKS